MPIIPNLPERLLFTGLNRAPAPLLDLFGAVAFRTVRAALNLGVFETLHESPQSPAELARRLRTSDGGTSALLEALEGFGYVSSRDGRYANSPMTEKWLVQSAPDSVAAGFDYWGTILDRLFGGLEESIRGGEPPENLYGWVEPHPDASESFQEWMVALSRLVAGEVVRKLKLPPTARRLLDVGGGHGAYSVALCREYPRLTATVFDLPGALEAARRTIAAEGMQDRVGVREGDFLEDELPSGNDVVLLFNIVHGFAPEQNAALLHKVAAALEPGGVIVVAEQVAGKAPGPASKAFSGALGLSYFHLLGGRIFSYEEISGWLGAAGFGEMRRVNLLRAPGNSLILGTKARGGKG